MIQEKAVICDACKQKLANWKCFLCNADLCGECYDRLTITVYTGYDNSKKSLVDTSLCICKKCLPKLELIKRGYNTEVLNSETFRDLTKKQIKSALILKEVQTAEVS